MSLCIDLQCQHQTKLTHVGLHIGLCKEVYMCMHCVVHCLGENKQLQEHSKPTIELSVFCCVMVYTENSPAWVLLMCHCVNRKQPCTGVVNVSLCEQKTALSY